MSRVQRRKPRKQQARPLQALKKIAFTIDSMDPLGQGVSREGDNVYFISKTLPGEQGTARVVKSKKQVHFARLESLETTAPNRIESECPHFASCPGCDFLHTDYASELGYKKAAMEKYLGKLKPDALEITLVPAPERFAYRNRMQLHYRHKYLGLIDSQTDQVVEIPECKMIRPELQLVMQALYRDKSWSKEQAGSGHCEIYLKQGEASIAWNEEYAHGGFTQVNETMNEQLKQNLKAQLEGESYQSLLDLFAGNGNLSDVLVCENTRRVMVDFSADNGADNYLQLNLYDEEALARFQRRCKDKAFDVLLVDPPRKGFPQLAEWVQAFKPAWLLYVSCNPVTLARDLSTLQGRFTVDAIQLLDMFPGTHHFESLISINFKRHE